ncbi:hypothetical protein BDQ12DRAFT_584984, partial [Crucibulum laeve]
LKFDDFLSRIIELTNGISQGCPASMITYIIYNADLIELALGTEEGSIGYVDDSTLIVVGTTFEETT